MNGLAPGRSPWYRGAPVAKLRPACQKTWTSPPTPSPLPRTKAIAAATTQPPATSASVRAPQRRRPNVPGEVDSIPCPSGEERGRNIRPEVRDVINGRALPQATAHTNGKHRGYRGPDWAAKLRRGNRERWPSG